jgi:hypothetical protein
MRGQVCKSRFSDFDAIANDIKIFKNPFNADIHFTSLCDIRTSHPPRAEVPPMTLHTQQGYYSYSVK